ncbi:Mss4p nuclear export [Quaeritorhiza haematococci]|nr:Mss4p nuclear export [Quaeritorhiza haematococci]
MKHAASTADNDNDEMLGVSMEQEKQVEKKDKKRAAAEDDAEDEDDDDEQDIVNVTFDFFDPKPIDYHGIKNLIRQTFSSDAAAADDTAVNLSELADLVLAQPEVGSVVKVEDDQDQDPYAVLTVVNLNHHKDKECISQLRNYLLDKSKKKPEVHSRLSTLLNAPSKSTGDIGIIFNERLINMPPQIFPPMLKMLMEEIEWAVEDGLPFKFEYFLLISKTYKEVESTADDEEENDEANASSSSSSTKHKKKKNKVSQSTTTFFFQPEDEYFQAKSTASFDFKPKNQSVSDSRRTFQEFGIDPARKVLLIHHSEMKAILEDVQAALQ